MKKDIVIILAISLILTGCIKQEYYETILRNYAKDYYETFVKGMISHVDNFEVTVAMLMNVENESKMDFDTERLHKCSKDSKVVIQIDENEEILGYLYDISCN